MSRRPIEERIGFGVQWTQEGFARLTDFERIGMWASTVLELYLNGRLHRASGRSSREQTTLPERIAAWDATNGRCAYCGRYMHPFTEFTVDHFVSLANGGLSGMPNLVPACHTCNGSKRDRAPETFFAARGPKPVWMAEAALAYYRRVLRMARKGDLVTFHGPPLWILDGLVLPPDPPKVKRHRKRPPKED